MTSAPLESTSICSSTSRSHRRSSGTTEGAGSQRTAFCGTGQHRPDERERESGVGQRDDLAGGENLSSTVVAIAVVTTHGRQQPLSLVVAQHPWTGVRTGLGPR